MSGEISTVAMMTPIPPLPSQITTIDTSINSIPHSLTSPNITKLTTSASSSSHNSWLLRFFESKHFDMSIAIAYLFNTKEPGVQTYLCNRLFTFANSDVDFYLPQLLNIYIYCCTDTGRDSSQQQQSIIADLLNTYFRTRCSCRMSGIDFSLRCSWLLDAHINDNAKLATQLSKESKRVKRGLNNAIRLYKQITSERLRPGNGGSGGSGSNGSGKDSAVATSNGHARSMIAEESVHELAATSLSANTAAVVAAAAPVVNSLNGFHDVKSEQVAEKQ